MPRASALRLVAIGGVLAFAALALANGFDRASAQRPALAVYVPAPFKAQAWRVESARALEAGDKDDATAAARAAVLADPVDPRSTALLGAAQLAAGERVKADRSFRIAARFGWRDPLTQLYFMNAALNAGEPRLAALRLDAVLRQAPNFPVRDMLLAQFLGSADARAALAERLALRPAWTFAFLNHASQLPLPEQQARAGIVAGMNPPWGCDVVAPLVTRLVLSGAAGDAHQLWRAQCPAAAELVADPHFAALPTGRAAIAFEWNLAASGDVSAMRSAVGGEPGLTVSASGPVPQPVAWQMLVLKPGRYRIGWTALAGDGSAAPGIGAALTCGPADRNLIAAGPAPTGGKGRFAAEVSVDASCPARYLVFWQTPGPGEARIDDVTLAPL
ncbi:MAG TPA: hypothetical protein PKN09_06420 [Novosphingobium sp.]|nr:hypothetical protein [Novosphingobium sp.]